MTTSHEATHAVCRAEIAGDRALIVTDAQCSGAACVARGHVTGTWLVPPPTSAEQRAELARDGARVVDGWWLTSAVWTAGDGA